MVPGKIDLGLEGSPADHRVVVAMSGGVDSSVVAALIKYSGYDTVGVTLQLYDHGAASFRAGSCCAGQDVLDARRVAAKLDIPHYVLNFESRFHTAVIEQFADSYVRGETPVPCVACNQTVKFHDLLNTAKELGASVLVTGHYVQSKKQGDHYALYRGADCKRDQSYFLFATTQEQLDFLRFPLGNMDKPKTRAYAQWFDLDVAQKPDSQDICFVPSRKYTDIVERLRPDAHRAGHIVNEQGDVLGVHDGIFQFTVGQRKGLGITGSEPLYVLHIDPKSGNVVVGPRDAIVNHTFHLRDVNWLGSSFELNRAGKGLSLYVRVRSTRRPVLAQLKRTEDGSFEVHIPNGEDSVAPGQACVFYESEEAEARVLGGGWILSKTRKTAHHEAKVVEKEPEHTSQI